MVLSGGAGFSPFVGVCGSYTLVGGGGYDTLFGGAGAPKLSNPISADLGIMRPSALPNLVAAVGRNTARGATHARLFELIRQGDRAATTVPRGQGFVVRRLTPQEAKQIQAVAERSLRRH